MTVCRYVNGMVSLKNMKHAKQLLHVGVHAEIGILSFSRLEPFTSPYLIGFCGFDIAVVAPLQQGPRMLVIKRGWVRAAPAGKLQYKTKLNIWKIQY
jgi:hypothetical protein